MTERQSSYYLAEQGGRMRVVRRGGQTWIEHTPASHRQATDLGANCLPIPDTQFEKLTEIRIDQASDGTLADKDGSVGVRYVITRENLMLGLTGAEESSPMMVPLHTWQLIKKAAQTGRLWINRAA